MDAARALNSTDDELFAAVADGDQTAFSELYDRFAPHVFGRVRNQVVDPLRAEEVTREVFLEFWRRAPRIDRRVASVTSWLFSTEHGRHESVPASGRAL